MVLGVHLSGYVFTGARNHLSDRGEGTNYATPIYAAAARGRPTAQEELSQVQLKRGGWKASYGLSAETRARSHQSSLNTEITGNRLLRLPTHAQTDLDQRNKKIRHAVF